jgi:hypothetical protein
MKNQKRKYLIPVAAFLAAAMLLFGLLPIASPARAAGSINLPRTTVPQGAIVAVSGTGFTAQDTVVVYVDAPVYGHAQRIETSTSSDGNGNFSTHLNLPRGVDAGIYTLVAKDTHGVTASHRLVILPLIVLRPNTPTTPATVVDRQGFFVDALGFQSGETVNLQATFPTYSGNDVIENRTAAADSNGNVYNVTFSAPPGAKIGWAQLTATGASSKSQAQGRVYIVYRPFIFLNHASVAPGSAVAVSGRGFESNATVRVQITIQSTDGSAQTITVTAATDNNGDFSRFIRIPGYTSPRNYTITVTGLTTGLKRYAKLVVSQSPSPKATATTAPAPTATHTPTPTTFHASSNVFPSATLPNQFVTMVGQGFPANATVTVSVTVDIRGGGNRYISKTVVTDGNGTFATTFRVPYKAAAGTYTVTASTSKAQASDKLQVLSFASSQKSLNFRWVSLWYHTVRQGTYDYVAIQSTLQVQLGIWIHVIFPNGKHLDFYTNTDNNGRFATRFNIPRHGTSNHSNQAYVTFQLWHGSFTTQSFLDFTLV